MTETQPSVTSVALKYGFITALVGVVYTLIIMVADLGDNRWLSGLSYLILIAGIVLAMKQYKNINYGYMSYGQGLGIGTLVSAVFGLLSGIFVWIYTSFVDTGYMDRMMEKQREAMLDQGLTDEQIDAGMAMTESFQGPLGMILGGLIGAVVVGFLLSLIISAIMKHNRPEFE
ncbi:DUF4199 domain-containing protein [Pontibacter sp. KCTC 32443]|uniref:DUF4199 domain-containing protein n=1 Tax=Pontibacter TaxID=323449 RepID=UPI00164E49C9|nr:MULTISPECIES: DUF4199 domain-containing protein [Pontibacter]MBC5772435.1 DUF4199 domain-containing protein [Pontibacter sp. KCTC 32443]